MSVFIFWMLGLVAIAKLTRGWARAGLILFYLVGSVLVAL